MPEKSIMIGFILFLSLIHKMYLPFFLRILSNRSLRISQGSDSKYHMIVRDLPASQNSSHFLDVADISYLIDPNRTNSEGMGRQHNVFHSTGIIILRVVIISVIGRDYQDLRTVHIIPLSSQFFSYSLCQCLDLSPVCNYSYLPGLFVLSTWRIDRSFCNLLQFFSGDFFLLKGSDTSSCKNIFHSCIHHPFLLYS